MEEAADDLIAKPRRRGRLSKDKAVPHQAAPRTAKGYLKKGAVLNPNGRPKGSKNVLQQDVASMVRIAVDHLGDAAKKKNPTLKELAPGVAYLVSVASDRPELFMPLVRQLMPAKVDIEVQLMGRELLDTMTQRRDQLARMKQATLIEQEDDDAPE